MAKKLHTDLANDSKNRLNQMQTTRENTRNELRETRVRLRQMLDQTNADRKHRLTELMQSFQQTRQKLAADLHEASHLWQTV